MKKLDKYGSGEGSLEREKLTKIYEETLKGFAEGEVVKGKIVKIDKGEVYVDVNYKSEGAIDINEFPEKQALKVGDEVNVYIESKENDEGNLVLSKLKADECKNWQSVLNVAKENQEINGRVVRVVRGGFIVDVGMDAFLPASQVALRPVRNFNDFVGKQLNFKIVKIDRKRKNIVVSHRKWLEEIREKGRSQLLKEIKAGDLRKGRVKNLTDFGAFIDLGGMDGLLHITDITWGRISHPSEVLAVGEEVEVVVLDFDKEKSRVSLGLKQKTPNPWENIENQYPLGSKVKGKVVNIVDYGAFLELKQGVEGLIHISEMSWREKVDHPSKILNVGDVIEALVINVDKGNKKISLSIKQLETDPWILAKEKYLPKTKVKGIVKNIVDYGAFVELEEGIAGLIHISDLSWGRISHPKEILNLNDEVEVVILDVNADNKRISLSLKQLMPDPWQKISEKIKIGDNISGAVKKTTSFGIYVELEKDVDGFIPTEELTLEGEKKSASDFQIGEQITATVIEIIPARREIKLSIRKYLENPK